MAILFGDVKAEIGLVVGGGVGATDPRVLSRTNAAMRALMEDVPQGIFVGSVAQVVVAINPIPGGITARFVLPPSMDVALAFEPTGTTTPMDGWYNILNPSTFVDPDDIVDTVLVDQGFTGVLTDPGGTVIASGLRAYTVPELPSGVTSALVTGLRSFAPITQDSDPLFVQNVRAIKRMIKALEMSERNEQREEGEGYRKEAVQFLVNELDRALIDPQRFGVRLAQWRTDEHTYASGTLGNTYAKIALDMQGGQRIGRFKIQRLVYRALSWIFQRIYEYQLIERNRVRNGVPTLTTVPTSPTALVATSSDPSIPIQHEIIRQVVQAVIAEDHQGIDEDRGSGRLQPGAELTVAQKLFQEAGTTLMRVLDAQLENLRHTTYAAALNTIIAAGQFNTRGYVASKWALENEGGLKFSTDELNRLVNEAAREAVNYYNDFGKQERYSNANGPNTLTWTNAATDTSTLAYADYQVLDKLMLAQLPSVPAADADRIRQSAQADIERNLAAAVDAARNTARYARLGSGPATLGYITARFGLEVPDPTMALTYNDNQFRRWVNEAAREAVTHANFLGRTERYSNIAGPMVTTFAYALLDTDTVSYPDMEVLRRLVATQIVAVPETARGLRDDAFKLIERNVQQAIEAARNTQAQLLLTDSPDPQFGGMVAKCLLEIAGDSGQDGYKWSVAEVGRLVRQVWAQLVDEFNFQSRQEDYEQDLMAAPPEFPEDGDEVSFPFELVKLGVEALTCQDKNQEQRAAAYKTAAAALVQRNLVSTVERPRREAWEALLASHPYPQFGGARAQFALELAGRTGGEGYLLSDSRAARLVQQAWRQAADQFNAISAREDYEAQEMVAPGTVVSESAVIPFPFEVVKGLAQAQYHQDRTEGDAASALRAAALSIIERNLRSGDERARRVAWERALIDTPYPQLAGAVAQIGLEYEGTYAFSAAKVRRWLIQAWLMAISQLNFLTTREDYEQSTLELPTPTLDTSLIGFPIEIIKALAQSLICQDNKDMQQADALKARAFDLIQRNLSGLVERGRRTKWEADILANPFPQLGGATAQIGLELDGNYSFSANKLTRWVNQGWAMAASHYNFLSRREDYEEDEMVVPMPAMPSDVIAPFTLEVIKLLAESLIAQDNKETDRAASLKSAAFNTIQRDLTQMVEYARRRQCELQSALDPESFGYVVGRLGLDLTDGLQMSDAKRRRLANQAEESLANSGRWKDFEGQYLLEVSPSDRRVIVPVEIENIIYSEWYGQPIDLRGRKWFYTGRITRHGNGYLGWNCFSSIPMTFAGRDECGNDNYVLAGACCTSGNCDPLPPLKALCRRKWVLKASDSDPLLVTNYPALRMAVQALLDAEAKDYQGASIKRNVALKELDNELAVDTAGQKANVTVRFPGLPVGGNSRHRRSGRV